MATTLYGPGRAHARRLIDAAKINAGAWSFSAEDGNALLGDPPDWTMYGSWHLGKDSEADAETKAAWKYPFGKDGEVYAAALRAIASRASQQGDTAISEAASALLDAIPEDQRAAGAKPGFLTREAVITPATINVERRTVDMIWSTGARVERWDFGVGTYYEELSLDSGAVRLERLNSGAPFLAVHDAYDLKSVLGVVVPGTARVDAKSGEARATVQFSRRDDVEPIWRDVQDGIVRNVSVGYQVHRYEESKATPQSPMIRRAVDWEPYEISAVPMGADAGAKFRAREKERTTMMTKPPAAAVTEPEPTAEIEPTERDAGKQDEQARITGILAGCEAARLPMSVARKLIAENVSLVEAQGQILDSLRKGGADGDGPKPGPSRASIVGADPLENVWRGITGALLHRLDPAHFALDDNARQYRTQSVLRAAEECLEQRGYRTRGMSKMQLVAKAFEPQGFQQRSGGGLHTTSDFASILADVANKLLRRAYDEAPPTWMPISRLIQIMDFKPVKALQFGEAPELKKIAEHGEFTYGTIAEGKEQFALSTYGRRFGITRQAVINDDLNAFARLATGFALSARRKESDLVWAEILRNANMEDGNALFSTDHANLTGSGTAISVDSLGVGRALMQVQKGLDGATYLNLNARFLIVPPAKQTLAEQYTTAITPALGSSVNPFAGRLTVISEARLSGGLLLDGETIAGSGTAWYLAASPDQIDMVLYGFLEGQNGPDVESRNGWEIDGLEVKCRHDFVAHVVDHRGLYKNAGA